MEFVGRFDGPAVDQLEDSHKNHLLHLLYENTRFMPAVRAMYLLLERHTITPEDKAAIIQCLYKYAEASYLGPKYNFDLRESRVFFGWLLKEVKQFTPTADQTYAYLNAFDSIPMVNELSGAKMGKGGVFEADGRRIILEKHVAEYYQSGCLRKTRYQTISPHNNSAMIERLRAFSGGRFDQFTYCRDPALIFSIVDTEEAATWPPIPVHAPSDLLTVPPPALTRDAEGKISVYTGEAPCSVPPVTWRSRTSMLIKARRCLLRQKESRQ